MERDFVGIHMVEPTFLERVTEQGVFSILWPYLRLSAERAPVRSFHADGARCLDVGTVERLREAEALVAAGRLA